METAADLMMEGPFFSVVIPTYNRLSMLREAIASVDAQVFRDFEIVVADDGSTDGTPEWLARDRPDIILVSSGGKGAGGARNSGIAAASGRYISLLDSDDLWHPRALQAVSETLSREPAAALVLVSEERFEDADGAPPWQDAVEVAEERYATLLDVGVACSGFAGTAVWGALRRDCFERVGPFTEDRGVNMEDLDWLFLGGLEGPVIRIMSPPLLAYRLHGTQITKDPMQFYRSVQLFLRREASSGYPSARCGFRRHRIAEMATLPLNLLRGRGTFRRGVHLIADCIRVLGWKIELRHFPRQVACTLRSAFFRRP